MDPKTMTPDQFEDHLNRYGADLSVWPEHTAKLAQALLATSAQAKDLLEDALFLDDALDAYVVEEPSAALEARLLDLAPAPARAKSSNGLLGWLNLRTASVAAAGLACAAFGFVVSAQTINTIQTDTNAEAFLTASASGVSSDFWSGEAG